MLFVTVCLPCLICADKANVSIDCHSLAVQMFGLSSGFAQLSGLVSPFISQMCLCFLHAFCWHIFETHSSSLIISSSKKRLPDEILNGIWHYLRNGKEQQRRRRERDNTKRRPPSQWYILFSNDVVYKIKIVFVWLSVCMSFVYLFFLAEARVLIPDACAWNQHKLDGKKVKPKSNENGN